MSEFKEVKRIAGFTNNKDMQTIYLEMYKTSIDVCILNKELFKHNYKNFDIDGEFGAVTWKNKDGRIGVFFPTKKDVTYENITHEIVHIVDFIYANIESNHSPNNPEPTAYLHGFLMKRILEVMKDFKIRVK